METDERIALLDRVEKEARENEVTYWDCSQVVLDVLQRNFNIGDREVLRAATAMGGGIVDEQEACGALIGAVMAVGLMYGRRKLERETFVRESYEYMDAYIRSQRLCDIFRDRFGSLRCSDVRKTVRGEECGEYDRTGKLEEIEGQQSCREVAGLAARMAAEVMLQPAELFADRMNAMIEEVREPRELHKKKRLERRARTTDRNRPD